MNQNTNNILEKEIKLWDRYEYALREENRILFREMLDKCRKNEYIDCVKSKGENFSVESLFLILILEQQKMIKELIGQVKGNTKNNK
jgi:hypothetical protein